MEHIYDSPTDYDRHEQDVERAQIAREKRPAMAPPTTTRIASDDCARRLELFRGEIAELVAKYRLRLSAWNCVDKLAIEDQDADQDSDWPVVASFTEVSPESGVKDWTIEEVESDALGCR